MENTETFTPQCSVQQGPPTVPNPAWRHDIIKIPGTFLYVRIDVGPDHEEAQLCFDDGEPDTYTLARFSNERQARLFIMLARRGPEENPHLVRAWFCEKFGSDIGDAHFREFDHFVGRTFATQSMPGWQIVPTKHEGKAGLTPDMFDAFWAAFSSASKHRGHFESVNAGYNAMLAFAPKPEAPPPC